MDDLVAKVRKAASAIVLEFQDEPLGMNVTRDDLDRLARATIPLVLRDAAEVAENYGPHGAIADAIARAIRARASEIEEQRG